MKRLRILALATVLALTLGAGGLVYADPMEPEGINTFTVSPDPASTTSDLTLDINFDFSDNDNDQDTGFCIEAPTNAGDSDSNWYGTMPNTINLHLVKGFTEETVSFDKDTLANSQSACPGGSRVALYRNTTTWSNFSAGTTDINASGTATVDLDAGTNAASAGTGNWILTLEEAAATPGSIGYEHELVSVTDVYASDQSSCGGYGYEDISCFQSLQAAIDAVDAGNDVVIVGTLTADSIGSTVSGSNVTTIRGIESPRLVAPSGCVGATLLTLDKTDVTVRGFTIDGSSCSGAAVGVDVTTTGATINNMTIQDFSGGTGVRFASSGAGTQQNSSISNNNFGVQIASGAGVVNIGTGPNDGNTLTNNTMGIQVADTNAVIKGNTVSGGTTGVALNAAPSAIYGNSVTGAGTNQIYCNGVTTGAAFNYLGGVSTSSGSNCADTDHQIGAQISGWADSTSYGDVSVSGGTDVVVFQLADDPYTFGSGDGDLSAFYAVRDTGSGDVTHAGSGTQAKMLMDASGCSPMTETCWESDADGRSQTGEGYYAVGFFDPTAITLENVTAQSPNLWLPVALVLLAALGMGGALILSRRRV